MNGLKVNHGAVWVCVVLLTGLGFLWYGPLFGEAWMGHVGLDMEIIEQNQPGAGIWISNLIATVVPLYVLAWLFVKIGVDSALQGAFIGFLIAFSFVFLTEMVSNMFALRPYALAWITGGYNLVGLALSGAILGSWRKYH